MTGNEHPLSVIANLAKQGQQDPWSIRLKTMVRGMEDGPLPPERVGKRMNVMV